MMALVLAGSIWLMIVAGALAVLGVVCAAVQALIITVDLAIHGNRHTRR